jgi:predicted translin family RNA/ssDNA-binding protein
LIADCDEAERAYNAADREDAEERYSEYLDLVETGTELLAGLRDTFAATMEEGAAEEYEEAFNLAVVKRLSRFALQIEDF